MGRKRKDKGADAQSKVDDFTIDKDEQLTVFTKEKSLKLTQEVIDMFDIKPVRGTNALSGHQVNGFTAKSYKESLTECYAWRDTYNGRKDAVDRVQLISYYPQSFQGKNILVAYDLIKI